MDHLIVDGVSPYDGRYEMELAGDHFTTREWGWIKRFAGILPTTLEAGLRGYDPELICSYAVIALHRAGKIDARDSSHVFERLQDAPFGTTVRIEVDTDTAEEGEEELPSSAVAKLERERQLFWARFDEEFGDIGRDPRFLWDARLGYLGVGPGVVGDLTPMQLLECVDVFAAIHSGGG